jgi:drug/metabolite transporter (DMT)-like permease
VPLVSPQLAALAALWPRSAIEGIEPPPSGPPQGSRAVATVLLIFGSVLTLGGSLVVLLLGIGLALQPADRPGAAIVGAALVGVLPLGVGVALFALGLRRLPKAYPHVPS